MTASQHVPSQPLAATGAALWRATRRVAAAVRAIHEEQVLMWELLWLAGRIPVGQAGPLAWTPSLDGFRLTGSHLPTPDGASTGDTS